MFELNINIIIYLINSIYSYIKLLKKDSGNDLKIVKICLKK